MRRLAALGIVLLAAPAWGDHPTPLQSAPLSRTAAALILAAMLVIVIVAFVALAKVLMGPRDESEPE